MPVQHISADAASLLLLKMAMICTETSSKAADARSLITFDAIGERNTDASSRLQCLCRRQCQNFCDVILAVRFKRVLQCLQVGAEIRIICDKTPDEALCLYRTTIYNHKSSKALTKSDMSVIQSINFNSS